jgi:hypothetical protein
MCHISVRMALSRRKNGRGVKLTTHLQLVPGLRMSDLYIHSPTCHHGIGLNYVIKYTDNFNFL